MKIAFVHSCGALKIITCFNADGTHHDVAIFRQPLEHPFRHPSPSLRSVRELEAVRPPCGINVGFNHPANVDACFPVIRFSDQVDVFGATP